MDCKNKIPKGLPELYKVQITAEGPVEYSENLVESQKNNKNDIASDKDYKITFTKKYPHLTQPMNIDEISRIFPTGTSIHSIRKYNFHEQSPFEYADATSIIGLRQKMEDMYSLAKISDNIDFYGVFDGHGGWQIASLLKSELVKRFSNIIYTDYTNKLDIEREIRQVCWDIGQEIFNFSDCSTVGSTAVFALKFKEHLYIVNIGDSGAIVFDNKGNILLKTREHKPNDDIERTRIISRGGNVSGDRVIGIGLRISVSRSFGDNYFNIEKDVYRGFETIVSHEPTIYSFNIPQTVDDIRYHMVLGSDGFWDNCNFELSANSLFTFKHIVNIVSSKEPRVASNRLVKLAYRTRIPDNITAIVVNL